MSLGASALTARTSRPAVTHTRSNRELYVPPDSGAPNRHRARGGNTARGPPSCLASRDLPFVSEDSDHCIGCVGLFRSLACESGDSIRSPNYLPHLPPSSRLSEFSAPPSLDSVQGQLSSTSGPTSFPYAALTSTATHISARYSHVSGHVSSDPASLGCGSLTRPRQPIAIWHIRRGQSQAPSPCAGAMREA